VADDRQNLVTKVAALLAKAASTEHEPERQAFEAKAQALITRHQIDEAELGVASTSMVEREIVVEGWGNATRGVVHLWAGVAEINRCSVAHRTSRGWSRIVLFGPELDAELSRRLVEHLLPQLRLAILNDRPRSRMSYAIGWTHEVVSRLAAAREAAASQVSALVPTNVAARQALADAHDLRTERRAVVDSGAYGSGMAAGERVDLGNSSLPGPG
jgi:hypothetical protein